MPKVFSSVNIEFKGRSPATEMMEKAGLEVVVRHGKPGWPDDETREKVVGIDALLAGGENLNADTLGHVDTLKVIARNGVGYDKVDLDFCTERGIVVTYTPGAMADAVADHAFALLLGMTRQLVCGATRPRPCLYNKRRARMASGAPPQPCRAGKLVCGDAAGSMPPQPPPPMPPPITLAPPSLNRPPIRPAPPPPEPRLHLPMDRTSMMPPLISLSTTTTIFPPKAKPLLPLYTMCPLA